jgi:hypothetical protein
MTAHYSHLQSSEAVKQEGQPQLVTDAEPPTKRSGAKSKSKTNADFEIGKSDDVRFLVPYLVLSY